MRRFVTLTLIPAFFLCMINTVTSSIAAASQKLPNIVFNIADDLGYQELGCYGQKWIQTPNIDRIAKKWYQVYSVLFRECGLRTLSL